MCTVEKAKTTVKLDAHSDDVNAVAYSDESCQIICSGSDDSYVKVRAWVLLGCLRETE